MRFWVETVEDTICIYMEYCKIMLLLDLLIRASVDALCRDGTGQISCDPRNNCLKTR